MATYSLVHGAWHGSRGHVVNTPDPPIEDVDATVADYARVVSPADVVVGHSLGGVVIPLVEARMHVHVCALHGGMSWRDAFVPGFGDARTRDELDAGHSPMLECPVELAALLERIA